MAHEWLKWLMGKPVINPSNPSQRGIKWVHWGTGRGEESSLGIETYMRHVGHDSWASRRIGLQGDLENDIY